MLFISLFQKLECPFSITADEEDCGDIRRGNIALL